MNLKQSISENRQAKEALVSVLETKIKDAKSVFLVEYLGLSVDDLTKLRNDLRESNAELKIYKNRLLKIAVKNAGFSDLENTLIGPNAIIFSHDDEIEAARIVAKHAKINDILKFKAGIFNNNVIDGDYATELSEVPSKEVLLTKISAGLYQFVNQIALGLTLLDESHLKASPSIEKQAVDNKKESTETNEVVPQEEKTDKKAAATGEKPENKEQETAALNKKDQDNKKEQGDK